MQEILYIRFNLLLLHPLIHITNQFQDTTPKLSIFDPPERLRAPSGSGSTFKLYFLSSLTDLPEPIKLAPLYLANHINLEELFTQKWPIPCGIGQTNSFLFFYRLICAPVSPRRITERGPKGSCLNSIQMRNPFYLDSKSGFDWTLNPVSTGQ